MHREFSLLSYVKFIGKEDFVILITVPFHKVAVENVIPIHSDGNPCLSVCSYTYQDSKVENSMDVEIPPNKRPMSNI